MNGSFCIREKNREKLKNTYSLIKKLNKKLKVRKIFMCEGAIGSLKLSYNTRYLIKMLVKKTMSRELCIKVQNPKSQEKENPMKPRKRGGKRFEWF